jgi:hypothetical protein
MAKLTMGKSGLTNHIKATFEKHGLFPFLGHSIEIASERFFTAINAILN